MTDKKGLKYLINVTQSLIYWQEFPVFSSASNDVSAALLSTAVGTSVGTLSPNIYLAFITSNGILAFFEKMRKKRRKQK